MMHRRSKYSGIFERLARQHGVPADLVDAIAFVESGYDPSTIGQAGEIGIMQVMPSTAAVLGFRGNKEQLAEPETNIRYGVQYLAGALRLAQGDICRALMKYRAGHGEEVLSQRSIEYYRRARAHLAAVASPLAAAISIPIETPSALEHNVRPALMKTRVLTGAEKSRQFWAAHEARIKLLSAAIRAKWARLAQYSRR